MISLTQQFTCGHVCLPIPNHGFGVRLFSRESQGVHGIRPEALRGQKARLSSALAFLSTQLSAKIDLERAITSTCTLIGRI